MNKIVIIFVYNHFLKLLICERLIPIGTEKINISMDLNNDTQNNGIDQLQKLIWAKLIPLSKGLATYELSYDKTLVGRSAECFIRINDKRLSGKHCIIYRRESKAFVLDLSTNGTFVNNNKIGKNIEIEIFDLT